MELICKECGNELKVTDKIEGYDNIYECSSCGHPNGEKTLELGFHSYYYKVDNKDSVRVEQLLNENNISYTRYSDPLKAVCDEEVKRLSQELEENALNDEQASIVSERIFNTQQDLLNYNVFIDIFESYNKER